MPGEEKESCDEEKNTAASTIEADASLQAQHRGKLAAYLVLLRPEQWTKNSFLFAALVFSKNVLHIPKLLEALAGFLIFCFLSSAIYIINDILDIKKDRLHPKKRKRPLAAGHISPLGALFIAIILAALGLGGSLFFRPGFTFTALGFLALHIAYSASLKRVVILDVFCIAAGFLLRVVAGAKIIDVPISPWLLICTTLVSLFIGFAKRRHELVLLEKEASRHRASLTEYSPYLLDQMISVVTASTVIAYALYTLSEETIRKFGTNKLMYTIPFVLFGILRYLYLIHKKGEGGSPERIMLTDIPFLVNLLLYGIVVWLVLY
jgi:4-hydroxybenzoate polyprenyltransferase